MKKSAKNLTLAILAAAFIVGCIGSFIPSFKMESYISFLKGFSPLYISLIASIGTSSVVKNIKLNSTN
jgi:uncharacterized membrane protein YjjB (DUF3815 family)